MNLTLPSLEERTAAFLAFDRGEYALMIAFLERSRDYYLSLLGTPIPLAQAEVLRHEDPKRQVEATTLAFVRNQQRLNRRLAAEFAVALGNLELSRGNEREAIEHFIQADALEISHECPA